MPPVCYFKRFNLTTKITDGHCLQKQAHHKAENHQELSEEDKKILEDAHKNRNNPNHPAHEKHPEVCYVGP